MSRPGDPFDGPPGQPRSGGRRRRKRGRPLGGIWAAIGRHLGGYWGAIGLTLGGGGAEGGAA